MSDYTLLLVDDETNVLKSLKRLLIDLDCKVITAETGSEALEKFENREIQLVISDYRMPEMDGVEFLNKVKEISPDTVRIILSGYADAGAMMEAINQGQVYKFIPKPWDDQFLITTIKDSFERYRLQKENAKLYAELSEKYKELQELTKTLEDKVTERTRDLEIKNRALAVAQNILNYLPAGVIGVDSSGMVVYMNEALRRCISVGSLLLGTSAQGNIDDEVYETMQQAMQAQEIRHIRISEPAHSLVICAPLPGNVGVIGLFIDSHNIDGANSNMTQTANAETANDQ